MICVMFNKKCPGHPDRNVSLTGYHGKDRNKDLPNVFH